MTRKTARALRLARTECGISKFERRIICGGSTRHKESVRAYNRTLRRHARALCREAIPGDGAAAANTIFVDGELLDGELLAA